MKENEREISIENSMDIGQAVAYLEDIVSSLKAGRICILHGENEVELSPAQTVKVEIKAKKRPEKESVALKIDWRPVVKSNGEPPVKISSTPRPAPEAAATSAEE